MSEALRMSKASRWAVVVSVTVTAGLALVLTFLLAIASNHRDLYERHYNWLLWVNIGVASLLALVLMGAGVRLFQRVRNLPLRTSQEWLMLGCFSAAAAMSVIDATQPAVAESMRKSAMSDLSTSE